ncbi:MAG: hypothetical protein ACI4TP_07270, partial [Anaerotignum sp.]
RSVRVAAKIKSRLVKRKKSSVHRCIAILADLAFAGSVFVYTIIFLACTEKRAAENFSNSFF